MTDSLANWFQQTLGSVMPGELVIFITSMVPILDLRGGLLVASAMGIPMWSAIPICIVGNMIPVVLILLFITPLFNLMKKSKFLRPMVEKLEKKGNGKNAKKIQKAEFWGLVLFVGVPLPGTGAWTGALVAAMLDMRLKKAFPAIALGVVIAGIVVAFVTYGAGAIFFS